MKMSFTKIFGTVVGLSFASAAIANVDFYPNGTVVLNQTGQEPFRISYFYSQAFGGPGWGAGCDGRTWSYEITGPNGYYEAGGQQATIVWPQQYAYFTGEPDSLNYQSFGNECGSSRYGTLPINSNAPQYKGVYTAKFYVNGVYVGWTQKTIR